MAAISEFDPRRFTGIRLYQGQAAAGPSDREQPQGKSRGIGDLFATHAYGTVHDLRTTFATNACEELAVGEAIAGRILNHIATATTSRSCWSTTSRNFSKTGTRRTAPRRIPWYAYLKARSAPNYSEICHAACSSRRIRHEGVSQNAQSGNEWYLVQ